MGRRVILDTGVVIAAEQGRIDLRAVIGDDEPAIAAITAMEILVGVKRSDPEFRDVRALHTEEFFTVMPVEQYSIEVARLHALLSVHSEREGKARGAFELIIAATAAATGRTLVTMDDSAAFDALPGLKCEVVPAT